MPNHRENRGDYQVHYEDLMENHDPTITYCCAPAGCEQTSPAIRLDNLSSAARVACNNEQCTNEWMHRDCFESWEQTVLTFLRSTGRARSWSEKQRLQNLWTKKGYDLAFKACGCKCGKGHLRKDLDWVPPVGRAAGVGGAAPDGAGGGVNGADSRKKRNRRRRNEKPMLGGSPAGFQNGALAISAGSPREGRPMLRLRSNSMSSTGSTSGSSPPSSSTGESPKSPSHLLTAGAGFLVLSGAGLLRRRGSSKFDFFSDRHQHLSSGSIFSRRLDYSSFNSLPRHKINSYHIKMEDEGNCGNDETRCFVLSNLAAARTSLVCCVLCSANMLIFDQYPLIDGTFFLSPRQYSKGCLQVKVDGRLQFLGAVCMGCLEGWSSVLRCRFCLRQWNGTSLILGTMYSYDIFAANPCCLDRLRCTQCRELVVMPDQRCNYSDYSNAVPCPHCAHIDYHFVKPLVTFERYPAHGCSE